MFHWITSQTVNRTDAPAQAKLDVVSISTDYSGVKEYVNRSRINVNELCTPPILTLSHTKAAYLRCARGRFWDPVYL